ncbi:MAG: hypothetical protein BRD48_00640 [Bacteroidetes bacterium QS_9_68_14]|nr:MAG: hypothetical protein BRD48_00640 [Bacteroidetes bacterium QS_9_68_14]
MSLHGERAFIGAPYQGDLTGMVGVYALSGDGSGWQPAGALHPFDGGQRHYFGNAIAHVDGETWVSALGSKQGSGRIYAFTEGDDGGWTSSSEVVTGENEQDLLGRSLAAGDGVAAVGAQGLSEVMILGPSGADMSNWVAQATFEGDPGGLGLERPADRHRVRPRRSHQRDGLCGHLGPAEPRLRRRAALDARRHAAQFLA